MLEPLEWQSLEADATTSTTAGSRGEDLDAALVLADDAESGTGALTVGVIVVLVIASIAAFPLLRRVTQR
jgi:hypothetical protein